MQGSKSSAENKPEQQQSLTASITYSFAKKHRMFFANSKELLCVENPDIYALLELKRINPQPWVIKSIPDNDFHSQLERHYASSSSGDLDVAVDWDDEYLSFDTVAAVLEEPDDLLASQDDAPVIKLLNSIFFEAIRERASDIHVEPFEKKLFIRFRLDGVLHTKLSVSSKISPFLISRIKVLAKLDIAEKRLPQDGHIGIKVGQRYVDLRVSTLPSAYGERAVLRLLDQQETQLDLHTLGMPQNLMDDFSRAISMPNGIVLVTGPTGSGKTTTLYGSLERMDKLTLNIMTVEDPLEYYFEGISQTQVNTKAGMGFANGLRAILRQDPDVIMIGEIRDIETANIAVQASLTGHLVLSTLHTNHALGAVIRLRDMGVEAFLLSSTLQAVLAQRLVRQLCKKCTKPSEDKESIELFKRFTHNKEFKNLQIHTAVGCKDCYHTGYQGRIGIYELVLIDDNIRQMVSEQKSETVLKQYLTDKGHLFLPDQAIQLVLEGKTTIEEVVRTVL